MVFFETNVSETDMHICGERGSRKDPMKCAEILLNRLGLIVFGFYSFSIGRGVSYITRGH